MRASFIAILSGALALLMLGTAEAGPATHELRQANNNYKFAQKALHAGNFSKARIYYDKALKILPNFPEAHLGMGHIAMAEKKYPEALREYELARDGWDDVGDLMFEVEMMRFLESQDQMVKIRDQVTYYRSILQSAATASMNTSRSSGRSRCSKGRSTSSSSSGFPRGLADQAARRAVLLSGQRSSMSDVSTKRSPRGRTSPVPQVPARLQQSPSPTGRRTGSTTRWGS